MDSAEKAKARGQAAANVTLDWQPVEEFMLKFDVMKVKNYAEDIDSLLTFAGLFSAVLTAFVVETYGMLQEDDTTNLLLAGISSQLGQSVGSLNTTISKILSAQNAATTTTARWINALFFLSLIFSLAAAFFGILAKQWLREYMLWNYPTDNARDNVLLRQARFDALEEWQVGAIIASVPALLELAMILFLVGITILLWTLDTVVAIVVTVAVVLFLAVVAAFMVLPVIFRRCPYKSPTAWALAVLYDFVCALAEYAHARWASYADNVRRVRRTRAFHLSRAGWLGHCALAVLGIDLARDKPFRAPVAFTYLAQSWRDRDRAEERAIHTHGRGLRRAHAAVTRALEREQTPLTRDGRPAAAPAPGVAHAGFVVKYALLDLRHVTTLFHSLLWVHRACPDAGTRARLQRCVASIHTPFGARDWPYRPYEPQTRMLTLWHLLSGATMWDERMGGGIPGPAEDVHALRAEIARLFVFERRRVRDGMRVVAMVDTAELFNDRRNRRVFDATQSSLLAPLLAVDLADTVAHLDAARKADSGLKPDDEKLLLPTTVRRVLELMCALFEVWQRGARPNETTLSLDWICAFISDPTVADIAIHQYPGLWSSAIVIASELNVKLSYSPQSGLVATEAMYGTSLADLGALIGAWFDRGRDFGTYVHEDQNVFVLLTGQWLRKVAAAFRVHADDDACARAAVVLRKMTELAEYALDRGIRNCGCFDALPWVRLLQRERLHSALVELGQGPALCTFLDVLERSVREQQLIPGLVVEDEWNPSPNDRAGVYVSDLRKLAHQAMAKNTHCPQCPHVLGTGIILEHSGGSLPRFESIHSSVVDGIDLALPMPQPGMAFPIPTPLDDVFPSISPRDLYRMFPGSHHTLSEDRPHTPVDNPRPPTPSTSDGGEEHFNLDEFDGQDLGLPIPHFEFPQGLRDGNGVERSGATREKLP